jgi:glycosyltransferase involved in cell wall biosynthesis
VTSLEIVADLRTASADVAAELVRRWAAEDRGQVLVHRATFAVPEGSAPPAAVPTNWRVVSDPLPIGFWEAVLAAAGNDSRPVLALLAPIGPGLEAAGILFDLIDRDAMFGAAIARLRCARGCCVRVLADGDQTAAEWMPRDAIAELPVDEIVDDPSAACLLLKPTLLTEFGDADMPFASLAGTLRHRLASARRCGFRSVVGNRALVTVADADCGSGTPLVSMAAADATRLAAFDADAARGWQEFRGAASALFETLTSHHLRAVRGERRPSLLLDMRNVSAGYNGTSFAAIGAARGLHAAASEWDVAILANAAGAEFHALDAAFPGWTVYTTLPPPGFNIALRLSQPWHIQEMVDLHRVARLNAYLMLDTISWDVVYVAPAHLDGTWQFLAASADSLFFISEFSRQRFCTRFPGRARSGDVVCHLSFDPTDYVLPELLNKPPADYFLVIGNHLEHKDVTSTVDLLTSAFPAAPIETLGPVRFRSPRVTSHASGHLEELDVQQLYARARLAVFPSFYEGFGLPIVTALAYGRTLLARESSLLAEIASRCQPRGRLIGFRQRNELVEHIGRLMHGKPVPEHPLGTALRGDERPRSWLDVGQQVHRELRRLLATASTTAWRARNDLVAQAVAYRS